MKDVRHHNVIERTYFTTNTGEVGKTGVPDGQDGVPDGQDGVPDGVLDGQDGV